MLPFLPAAQSVAPSASTPPLVVQHNALINARFQFGPLEARLFLQLLGRIGRNDTHFQLCRVEVHELVGELTSHNTYALVREAVEKFATRTVTIEQLSGEGRRTKQPDYVVLPLLSIAQYRGGEGAVEVRFNDAIMPYLLELRDNFTKAQLTELLKLKSPYSHRIYWLLREYARFGQRVVSLADLKAMLKVGPGYDRWDNFKGRVLDRVQEELAATDLSFTYETLKQGRMVTGIRFLFKGAPLELPAQVPVKGWETRLLGIGIAASSLGKVRTQVEAGLYDEGYIDFVLKSVRSQVAAGKIKKEAGAVFKALTEGYLLADYQQKTQPGNPSGSGKSTAAKSKLNKKLLNEIDDLQRSVRWIQLEAPEPVYPGAKRAEAVAKVEKQIAAFSEQLTNN